jgi:hypothetical protein
MESKLALTPSGFGLDVPEYRGRGALLEGRVGGPRSSVPFPRIISPEDSNADLAKWDASVWNSVAGGQLPPAIPVSGQFTLLAADYNVMANNQFLRAGCDLIGALGRNDQTTYNFTTGGGGVFNATNFSLKNMILGAQIEWGLSLLNASPFNMQVSTSSAYAFAGHPVDRSMTLRFDGNMQALNGGIFTILFGARMTPQNPYGSPPAQAGMNKAIVTPAWMDGTSINLQISIPSALASYFTATCHLLTPASPYLAALRDIVNGQPG